LTFRASDELATIIKLTTSLTFDHSEAWNQLLGQYKKLKDSKTWTEALALLPETVSSEQYINVVTEWIGDTQLDTIDQQLSTLSDTAEQKKLIRDLTLKKHLANVYQRLLQCSMANEPLNDTSSADILFQKLVFRMENTSLESLMDNIMHCRSFCDTFRFQNRLDTVIILAAHVDRPRQGTIGWFFMKQTLDASKEALVDFLTFSGISHTALLVMDSIKINK
jgi:hypothetical protein